MFALIRNEKGMTLIEAIVAVAILAVLVVPLAGLFTVSSLRARSTVLERRALALAEAKIESLRQEGFEGYLEVSDGLAQEWTWVPGDKFTGTVKSEVYDDGVVKLYKITVSVAWDSKTVSVSTLVSKYRW